MSVQSVHSFVWDDQRSRASSALTAALSDLHSRWRLSPQPSTNPQSIANSTASAVARLAPKDAAVKAAVLSHIASVHSEFLSTQAPSPTDPNALLDLWGKLDMATFRTKAAEILFEAEAWSLFDKTVVITDGTGGQAGILQSSRTRGGTRRKQTNVSELSTSGPSPHQFSRGHVAVREELFKQLEDLLDLAQCSADLKHSNDTTPMQTIEDLMEMLPLEGCEMLFDLLEERAERLLANMLSNKGKGVIFLRFCNELLRRLSRTRNTGFAGRIIMLMTAGFPLSERSAVNLPGNFNLDNNTFYGIRAEGYSGTTPELLADSASSDGELEADSTRGGSRAAMDVDSPRLSTPLARPLSDSVRPSASSSSVGKEESQLSPPVQQDDLERMKMRLYLRFWGLQDLFRNPPSILDAHNWQKLQKSVEETLKAFEKAAQEEMGGSSSSGSGLRDRDRDQKDRERDEKEFKAGDKSNQGRDDRISERDRRREDGGPNGTRESNRDARGGGGRERDRERVGDRSANPRKRPRDERIRTEVKDEIANTSIVTVVPTGQDFFPKFLTGYNLFDLQLHDPLFRRHILVQLLIIFQNLLLTAPAERLRLDAYRTAAGKKPPSGEAPILSKEQEQWLEETRKKVFEALDATGAGVKNFRRTVVTVLGHEKNWLKWKMDTCPVYDRPSLSQMDLEPKKKRPRTLHGSFLKFTEDRDLLMRSLKVSEDPMSQLALDGDSRPLVPSLEYYFEGKDGERHRAQKDLKWLWKVYRLISKRYPEVFSTIVAHNKAVQEREKKAKSRTSKPESTETKREEPERAELSGSEESLRKQLRKVKDLDTEESLEGERNPADGSGAATGQMIQPQAAADEAEDSGQIAESGFSVDKMDVDAAKAVVDSVIGEAPHDMDVDTAGMGSQSLSVKDVVARGVKGNEAAQELTKNEPRASGALQAVRGGILHTSSIDSLNDGDGGQSEQTVGIIINAMDTEQLYNIYKRRGDARSDN
ncbi:hypothetical protein HDU93_003978 [Gonapodya sp. JEL0774]|nr:hypothetical protein HDU93_003978 [Gonapodya sp. JEL0774]